MSAVCTFHPRASNNKQVAVFIVHMNATVLICVFCILALASVAQPLEHAWARRVGGLQDGEKLWRIAVDGDGNVYAAGQFRGTFTDQGQSVTSVGGADIILVKYSPDGELLWVKRAGGPLGDAAFGVDCDKNGNVYITGAFSGVAVFDTALVSVPDPDGVGLPFHFVARYSPDGELAWVRTVEVPMALSTYPFSYGYAVKLDRNGDLIIGGAYANINADPNDPGFSTMRADTCRFRTCGSNASNFLFAQKMDTLGNTRWVHTIGGIYGQATLLSIAFDPQGDIWFGGNISGNDLINGPVNIDITGGTVGLAYELSSQGEVLSGFAVPATGLSNVEDLIVALNGEVFLAGWHQGGSLNGGVPAQGYDGFLLRATATGNLVWANELRGVGDDFFTGIATTLDPNVIVGGAFYFYQADLAGATLATASGNNSALVRVDTMGNFIDALQPVSLGGNSKVADVQSDDFGNFFLCGDVEGMVLFTGDTLECPTQDMYVTKIRPATAAAVGEVVAANTALRVFPNPAVGSATVILPADARGQLLVLDALGREVRAERAFGPSVELDLEGLPAGTYLVSCEGKAARSFYRLVVRGQ